MTTDTPTTPEPKEYRFMLDVYAHGTGIELELALFNADAAFIKTKAKGFDVDIDEGWENSDDSREGDETLVRYMYADDDASQTALLKELDHLGVYYGFWERTGADVNVGSICPCCTRGERTLIECGACGDFFCQDCLDDDLHSCLGPESQS